MALIDREAQGPNLTEIIKTIREPILVVAEDMRVIDANDAAIRIFSGKHKVLLGRRLSEIVRSISVHEACQKAFRENRLAETRLKLRKKRKIRNFDVNMTRLNLGESKIVIGVFYDVTQVDHLQNVRQQFLSNISHELRTPLTSILAFIETLENSTLDDKTTHLRFLGIIRKNALRMQHLIDDISELSLIESASVEIDPQDLNLRELIGDVFGSLFVKAEERNIFLENKIDPETVVCADRFRLEQMLINIVDNAIKFNKRNGIVTVTFDSDGSSGFIRVSDTGEGILPEKQKRIFERLYQVDRARTREIGGTGLGLAIVKHLAILHDGDVTVRSKIGKGATFTIRLPLSPEEKE